jgi:hypothetical protein
MIENSAKEEVKAKMKRQKKRESMSNNKCLFIDDKIACIHNEYLHTGRQKQDTT